MFIYECVSDVHLQMRLFISTPLPSVYCNRACLAYAAATPSSAQGCFKRACQATGHAAHSRKITPLVEHVQVPGRTDAWLLQRIGVRPATPLRILCRQLHCRLPSSATAGIPCCLGVQADHQIQATRKKLNVVYKSRTSCGPMYPIIPAWTVHAGRTCPNYASSHALPQLCARSRPPV